MANIGYGAVLLTLVAAAFSAFAAVLGARLRRSQWIERAATGLLAASGSVALATAILLYLLLARDFRVHYVYAHTSSTQPMVYVISALWAGQEGSFLLWLLWLGVVSVVALRQRSRWPASLWPYIVCALSATQAFFALVLLTVQNPFSTYALLPPEGAGLLPALLNPGMLIHPPILFLGYALYAVPFAFTLAQLAAGNEKAGADPAGLTLARQWSLLAWLFLGLGILIGAWWAYVELGWGGYWTWDPVENASLLPWLVGTAYLHALLARARQGIFKRWSAVLAIGSFLLCIFGTLVTRGGIIISELHGFSSSIQPVAYYLLGFMAAVVSASVWLLRSRWKDLADTDEAEHLLSRESSVLLTTLLFVGLAAAVLVGMLFPSIAQVLRGTQVYLQTAFYNRVFAPLALCIVLLMAVCPLLGWKESSPQKLVAALRYPAILSALLSVALLGAGIRQPVALVASALVAFAGATIIGEFLRAVRGRQRLQSAGWLRSARELLLLGRRRYGAHAVHLAILLITIGVTGSSLYKTETQVELARQGVATVRGYGLKYEDLTVLSEPGRQRFIASIGIYQGPLRVGTLQPEKTFHANVQDFATEVAIRTSLKEDLYVSLDWLDEQEVGTFRVSVYPLVIWLWIGGALLLFGTLAALWPESRERHEQHTI
jgi:cytochrome c-type biogenesis protein CcmF